MKKIILLAVCIFLFGGCSDIIGYKSEAEFKQDTNIILNSLLQCQGGKNMDKCYRALKTCKMMRVKWSASSRSLQGNLEELFTNVILLCEKVE